MFADREEAAKFMAQNLEKYKGAKTVVLAVPNGALPMSKTLADLLGAELDVILVKKIGAPGNPQLTIGILSESGEFCLTEIGLGLSREYIEKRMRTEWHELLRRRKQYLAVKPQVDLKGRTVIIVDDGMATGATALVAVRTVRAQCPEKVVVAAVVAAPDAVERLKKECDEVTALVQPVLFHSVETYFQEFPQVNGKEAVRVLQREAAGA